MKCIFCNMNDRVDGSDYCGRSCLRTDKHCARLKRIEDVLVEIKYELRR